MGRSRFGGLLAAARTASPSVASDASAHRAAYLDPSARWSNEEQARVAARYYDLVTDFYEYGWGQSFHFAVRRRGDTLGRAIEAHEAWIGQAAGFAPGVRAVDLGCGVGGPLRFLARTTGAHVTGVNVNGTQVARARERSRAEGLGDRVEVVEASFTGLPMPDSAFDAAYTIEATCHAADRVGVYREAWRVLRRGGRFVGYEWCTTPAYDAADPEHAAIARGIAEGNALPPLLSTAGVDEALRAAGFELEEGRDVAQDGDAPWWGALEGEGGLRAWPRTRVGRRVTSALVRVLEAVRVAPRGATEVSALLNQAADALVAGGRRGVFTPMYRFSAVKP